MTKFLEDNLFVQLHKVINQHTDPKYVGSKLHQQMVEVIERGYFRAVGRIYIFYGRQAGCGSSCSLSKGPFSRHDKWDQTSFEHISEIDYTEMLSYPHKRVAIYDELTYFMIDNNDLSDIKYRQFIEWLKSDTCQFPYPLVQNDNIYDI